MDGRMQRDRWQMGGKVEDDGQTAEMWVADG